MDTRPRPCVVALAGRRIDATDADAPRFPLNRIDRARQDVRALLKARAVTTLVSSAACGADLIALDVARELGLRRRIVLPFAPAEFRASSVTDRPGDWGRIFDAEVAHARGVGDLVVLEDAGEGSDAYAAANAAILDEAAGAARQEGDLPLLAVLVWDGRSRGEGDLTEAFGALARSRGVEVTEIRTLAQE